MKVALKSIGKYLDQPLLTEKLRKKVPIGLSSLAIGFTLNEASKEKEKEQKIKKGIETGVILGATIATSLAAPKIATSITNKKSLPKYQELIKNNTKHIDEFLSKKENLAESIKKILEKAKKQILTPKEIYLLLTELKGKTENKFLDKLIPPPENISSKDIFSEISWLSIVGAIPIFGGISGGVAADKINNRDWKQTLPNKIKEGTYQYLANIFLCNVGAGAALGILEKSNVRSRMARGIGMTAGIILTGVIGGSKIANIIGNKCINPLIEKNRTKQNCEERTPELIDIGLHTDDIATVSLLSGLKWIEPTLPILYSVSGYRAGIGYRNNN